jgi:hypothetical protein
VSSNYSQNFIFTGVEGGYLYDKQNMFLFVVSVVVMVLNIVVVLVGFTERRTVSVTKRNHMKGC